MPSSTPPVDAALGSNGAFAKALPGFIARPGQQAMAAAVVAAMQDDEDLLIEAPTGVGKTFGYLVAVLLLGRKTIISTGTRTLQDQLFQRDLHTVMRVLNSHAKVALLKGRNNYLCLQRAQQYHGSGLLELDSHHKQLQAIIGWAKTTISGDLAELEQLADNDPILPHISSTGDNCLGQDCPCLQDCHVMRARRAALAADVVVVNHALLVADLAMKDEGFGELLPDVESLIIDEAHQFPQAVSDQLSQAISRHQLLTFARDCDELQRLYSPESNNIPEASGELRQAMDSLQARLGPSVRQDAWAPEEQHADLLPAINHLHTMLQDLCQAVEAVHDRALELNKLHDRGQDIRNRLQRFLHPGAADTDIRWLASEGRSFALNLTPLNISRAFADCTQYLKANWILTSATLCANGDFQHFQNRIGFHQARTLSVDSPFDFWHQSLIYLPPALPKPNDPDHTRQLVQAALPVLEASQGRAFMLFTSHRALQEAAKHLEQLGDFVLLVQGSASRHQLLERFKKTPRAVLLGAASFWEGVDVQGEALSCVIIDRLPFRPPTDPVYQARMEAIKQQGQHPFTVLQLPEAIITLKQGAGRLIRATDDHGVLMFGDPRLRDQAYGKQFINALPKAPKTQKLDVVQRFFQAHNKTDNTDPASTPA